MLIWAVPCLLFTGIVYAIDFLLRRKKWTDNTQSEKNGLILTLLVSFPYLICSAYGFFMGIVGPARDGELMRKLYEILLVVGGATFAVCLFATIASLVLRKMGKSVAANWSLLIGFFYCLAMLAASFLIQGSL